ncbi:MAG: hypothetical protein FD147_397 [Chloroflexi bacterium]|nr:MAG: hypothetical protein FD147_397 [Chloroflexota bacterium]MBA4376607.1 hypothetical protein [Anaerolinea sp.]
MGTTYRLILQSGAGSGTEYPLEKTDLYLGRDMSNDIVVNDPEVSRRHARLVLEGTTYRIEDLGSTNGTFIRGQRLAAPVLLRPGEIITIGEKVVLRFEVLVSDPNATVAVHRAASQATQPPHEPIAPRVPLAPPVTPPIAQAYTPVQAVSAYPPVGVVPPVQPPVKKKQSSAVIALLIVVGILVVFCIIPWIIIEATNSYCALFPGIFNSIMAGACP